MHYTCKYLICSIIWILCCMQQYCVSQSTTVRPYKFGFTIDQQQHRSEQRDERGIVMGEFGFITADGIYHVTVYATDEQGRFRILAMKNYPYESPPKMVEVMVQPKIPVTTTTTQKPLPRHNFNTEACSGCFLKNGNNKPKGLEGTPGKTGKNDIRPLSKPLSSAANGPASPKLSNKPSPGNLFFAQKENKFLALQSSQKDTILKAPQIGSLAMKELVRQSNIANKVQFNTTFTPATTKTKETKKYENISQNPLSNENEYKTQTHTNAQKTNPPLAPNAPQITQHSLPSVQHLNTIHSGVPTTANAFTKYSVNAPLNTATLLTTLQQHTSQTNSMQNLPKKSTAHGNKNTALANSLQPGQETQEFPLKSSTQTQNTNSANSNEEFGFTKPVTADKTPTHIVNTHSKDSNQQTSQPKPVGNSPPIMDIIMKKVLPAIMGSKSSTPTTLNNKSNASPPSSKIPGSNTANDFNRKTGSSANGDGDLYRFKYILDYHGHSETGKRNGNKEGTYFAIGDDNIERTIEYVANEFGYQPRIRWRKLSDNEIKSKENTLKDYEFIWFN